MEDADSPDWVGKEVRDIYGRRLGRAVGMVFEVGGKISSVGVEDVDHLVKINPDRITSDGAELVVIPEWMFEARNVGLDRGGLMKRFSALSLMVNEKWISEKLSKDIFARLSAIQKSHEAVLAKTMTRLEDLARADAEIDEFVSLVTLQHIAGEMSGESFDFTVAECEKIKVMNGREILDIRRILGMASGEQSVASPGDGLSPGSGAEHRPDEGSPSGENASGGKVLATSYADPRRTDMESQMPWDGSAPGERIEPAVNPVFERERSAAQEREGTRRRNEDSFEAPFRLERPNIKSAHLAASPGPDSSLAEPSSPVGSATAEVEPPSDGTESDGQPILGQEVSEWVFAKIIDLEALDVRPGDYVPLRSLDKNRD